MKPRLLILVLPLLCSCREQVSDWLAYRGLNEAVDQVRRVEERYRRNHFKRQHWPRLKIEFNEARTLLAERVTALEAQGERSGRTCDTAPYWKVMKDAGALCDTLRE